MPELPVDLLATLRQWLSLDLLVQVGLLMGVWVGSGLLAYGARGLLMRVQDALAARSMANDLPWLLDLIPLLQSILWPFLGWLVGQASIVGLQATALSTELLEWGVPLFLIWLVYRLLYRLLFLRLPPAVALSRNRGLLRPLFLLVTLLHTLGFLDDVWRAGFAIGEERITLGALLVGITVMGTFWVLARSSREALTGTYLPRAGLDPALINVLSTFAGYAILIIGFVTALNLVGIQLTTVAVILGGLSVGVGFGLQTVVSNFISGFILLFERAIGPGDVVRVGEAVGQIVDIGIRSMRIKTQDNVELIVPNSHFLTDIVTTYTRGDKRVRVRIEVGASYQSDPRQVERALLEAATHSQLLTEPPPQVQFMEFGESSLNFTLLVWTEDAFLIPHLQSELRYQIWERFAHYGLEMPYPHRELHIHGLSQLLGKE